MKSTLRILLVIALTAQAWHAIVLTRYERLYQTGQRSYDAWDAESALISFDAARDVLDADFAVWRRNGDMALYIHDYPHQVEEQHDLAEMLQIAWRGYSGAVLRCPVDSWSWSGLAEVALHEAELREKREGIDLVELERRSRGVLDPMRAAALAAGRLAVELKPSGFQELDVLASAYESIGDLGEARRVYAESARMMPVVSFHVWSQSGRLDARLYEPILKGLVEGVQRAPAFEQSMLHLEIARLGRTQGDLDTALEHIAVAEEKARYPNEVYNVLWEKTKILEQLGRLDDAIEALQRAQQNIKDPATISRKLGSLELRLGRFKEACVDLRQGLRRDPGNNSLRIRVARACEDAGEPGLAEQILQDGFVVPTSSPKLARALIDLKRRQGHNHFADLLVRRWADAYPDHEEFQEWANELPHAAP